MRSVVVFAVLMVWPGAPAVADVSVGGSQPPSLPPPVHHNDPPPPRPYPREARDVEGRVCPPGTSPLGGLAVMDEVWRRERLEAALPAPPSGYRREVVSPLCQPLGSIEIVYEPLSPSLPALSPDEQILQRQIEGIMRAQNDVEKPAAPYVAQSRERERQERERDKLARTRGAHGQTFSIEFWPQLNQFRRPCEHMEPLDFSSAAVIASAQYLHCPSTVASDLVDGELVLLLSAGDPTRWSIRDRGGYRFDAVANGGSAISIRANFTESRRLLRTIDLRRLRAFMTRDIRLVY